MTDPATIVRTYKGKPKQLAKDFEKDAKNLAKKGYEPVNQSGFEGRRSMGRIVTQGILFAPLLLRKPKGEMVVTYRKVSG